MARAVAVLLFFSMASLCSAQLSATNFLAAFEGRKLQAGNSTGNPYTCSLDLASIDQTAAIAACSSPSQANPACCTAVSNYLLQVAAYPGVSGLPDQALQNCLQFVVYQLVDNGLQSDVSECEVSGAAVAPSAPVARAPSAGAPYTCAINTTSVSPAAIVSSCSNSGVASPACCQAYLDYFTKLDALPGAANLTDSQTRECILGVFYQSLQSGAQADISNCFGSAPGPAPSQQTAGTPLPSAFLAGVAPSPTALTALAPALSAPAAVPATSAPATQAPASTQVPQIGTTINSGLPVVLTPSTATPGQTVPTTQAPVVPVAAGHPLSTPVWTLSLGVCVLWVGCAALM